MSNIDKAQTYPKALPANIKTFLRTMDMSANPETSTINAIHQQLAVMLNSF